ncbi:MAG: hypothetical protein OEW67_13090 [Cyclobacteriaceae bacterium]|nr:hypothetical protein [Cyclobacteriaceae bacterium]
MKKYKTILFLILLASSALLAQPKLSRDFKVTVSDPYKVVDGSSKEYFSDGGGHVVSIKTQGKRVTIQKMEIGSMKEVDRKEYLDFPEYANLQNIIRLGNKVLYLFEAYNKEKKTFSFYGREINLKEAKFEDYKLLFVTKGDVPISRIGEGTGFFMQRIRFDIFYSVDQSKFIVRYRRKPAKRNDAVNKDVLGFYVFDQGMNKKWGGEMEMPYTEKEMDNMDFTVSNDGTAYMLAYIRETKSLELLAINNSDIKISKIENDRDIILKQVWLIEDSKGVLSCSGYYANGLISRKGPVAYNSDGIYRFTMNTSGKLLSSNYFEFPLELLNQNESKRINRINERQEKKERAGISYLQLLNFITEKNGDMIFLGEQSYLVEKRNANGGSTITYYYNDIVITKIDKDNNLVWMKKLPKAQKGKRGKGGMSVRYIRGDDAHYLLYLDNINNASLGVYGVPKAHVDGKGGYLTAYKIDNATGEVEKHPILDITNLYGDGTEGHQFKTLRIFKVEEKLFMTEVYIKGKQDAMIKMELLK